MKTSWIVVTSILVIIGFALNSYNLKRNDEIIDTLTGIVEQQKTKLTQFSEAYSELNEYVVHPC